MKTVTRPIEKDEYEVLGSHVCIDGSKTKASVGLYTKGLMPVYIEGTPRELRQFARSILSGLRTPRHVH